jgi:4-diphosphocytidyl-2-C-methyl-D-erythritol kinase
MNARAVSTEAPAKVNLFLRLLDLRPDGYRELETVFQTVSLSDAVRVELDQTPGEEAGEDAISLRVNGPDLGPVADNLAWRAAEGFRTEVGLPGRIRIDLDKAIPAGAGLGGGSSDAAAVLRCLAALTDLADARTLHALATDLGSDVPFFLRGPVAMGRGRGEVLTPMPPLPERALVLALPPVHVATGAAYDALSEWRSPPSPPSRSSSSSLRSSPGALVSSHFDWPTADLLSENDFEPVVTEMHEEVRVSLEALRNAGALVALLSGSGGASFGFFTSSAEAEAVAASLSRELGWRFVAAVTRSDVPRIVPA